ncbi:MAG: hypothetical protein DRI26_00180 [Chloroflexi bacterium]|nr:MAG: hypothetical protein DRI26_00180 [Chloroflexota bacterium]
MSLHDLIMSLISDITDPAVRLDIAATINFLKEVYLAGAAPEEEILNDLREVCETVLAYKEPDLFGEELKRRAEELAKQMFRAIKIETMRLRMHRRLRPRFARPPR